MKRALLVWRFVDGKPGHERQTAGLLAALSRLLPLEIHVVPRVACRSAWRHALLGRWPTEVSRPRPALVVGAGSACALPMLAAARTFRARSVYLMNPPLPRRLFDLCLIPRHDGIPAGPGVAITDGVLNDLTPSPGPRTGPTLVLIGGPSRHHDWDAEALMTRLRELLTRQSSTSFLLTDSRRTPTDTSAALRMLTHDRVRFVPHTDCSADWLPATLSTAPAAWVTADSVSMLYEALTAGCALGILPVPVRHADRISRIADALIARGQASDYTSGLAQGLKPPREPVNEAERMARLIVARWFPA